jgi:hypothetical protein
MATKCSDCSYGYFPGGEEFGNCRRYPPSVSERRVDKEGDLLKGYVFRRHIIVHTDNKCGEFLAK